MAKSSAAASWTWRACCLVGWLAAAPLTGAGSHPNVLVFVVDDLGQRDLGCYGSTFYETPHIDRLAAEGIRFSDAYAACPVCSPTRASLLTGQWPQRSGITDYIGAPRLPEPWQRNTRLLPATYTDRLPLSTLTIAEVLGAAGYKTFFAGKWHLGPEGWWPEQQGFEINRGGTDQGGPYGGGKYFSPFSNPRLADGPVGEHLPDRLARETVQFIKSCRDQPFLAYLAFYSVHTPLMARKDLQQKYEAKRTALDLQPQWGREGLRDVRLVQEHAVYAGMVEAMDAAVGQVLSALDDLGLRENTIVVFTSDNGGLSTSEGWPTSNLPLRGGKGWLYEGGIRVPLVVRWPAIQNLFHHSRGGAVVDAPVASPDLYPTLLEACGIETPSEQSVDGVSWLPLLQGNPVPERALFWHYPHYGNQGGAPGAAIRLGPWKLIEWFEDSSTELFNLEEDLAEQHDRADDEPSRVADMKAQLRSWQEGVGVLWPTPNSAFDPAKKNGRAADRPR